MLFEVQNSRHFSTSISIRTLKKGRTSHLLLLDLSIRVTTIDKLIGVKTILALDREIYSSFELSVCLFLNSLGILQFLDQLHFKHLHLHHFGLFLTYYFFFLSNFLRDFLTGLFVFLSSKFIHLGPLDLLLLLLNLILHHLFLYLLMRLFPILVFVLL